ncbi:MAG: N-acetyl-gamma-glutamyl-phosphate reductase [Myxococcales bacterium]|nr:N-acetyl-gamma-glutamyl-phosphate reductase [Myxococcales bacterium]MCB9752403.1 N-acetyl-gamma-glutamyl-phosphate reductase [Myxococcales bacterium]
MNEAAPPDTSSSGSSAGSSADNATRSVGIIGARGHVGAELLALLAAHPDLRPGFVSSRALAGQRVAALVPGLDTALRFEALTPEAAAAREVDAWVLALPNGLSEEYAGAIAARHRDPLLLDLSADHRFTDDWCYGLPELARARVRRSRRIANPGCYATGMQLAIAPALELLDGPPVVFGVSGYSGAGTTPSPRNDPARLEGNLMPYSLTGHTHEAEVSRQLGRRVDFTPHVASFFRGISLTITLPLARAVTTAALLERYRERYASEPLVDVQAEIPEVKMIAGADGVCIGGFAVDATRRRAVLVATLDNLRKGAAVQALQNLNLCLGLPERAGLAPR